MAQRKCVRNSGFTLVELLVVISIIGLLIGLLLPAIRAADDAAKRAACLSNMRNVSTALMNYETAQGHYPGYLNVLMMRNGKPFVDPKTGKRSGVSFVVPLLPYLDRPDLYNAWKASSGAQGGGGDNAANPPNVGNIRVKLDILQCRADPQTNPNNVANSYVVNTGMQDTTGSAAMPRDWPENGVFFDLYTGDPSLNNNGAKDPGYPMVQMSSAYISKADGLQNTVLFSENVDAGDWTDTTEARLGMVWNGTGTVNTSTDPPTLSPPDDNMRINGGTGNSDLEGNIVQGNPSQENSNASSNSRSTTFARPSSYHPGGVNMAFCDGHAQFVSEQIDYYVYCLLMSTNGQRVRLPGSKKVLSNFGVSFNDAWLRH